MKPIVIIGSGGYAQELIWIIEDMNEETPTWECLGFIDPGNPERKGSTLYDFPVLGGFDEIDLPNDVWFACGIGDPRARTKECAGAEALGWKPATLIHPTVVRARHVEIGEGTVIGAGSILAPHAHIGRHCSINLQVTVGHNSVLGDFCVLSPGTRISGGAVLKEGVFVGSNATIYLNRRVGEWSSVGANSFLVTNLAAGRSAIGNPAKAFGPATGAGICTNVEKRGTKSEASE